MTQNAETEETLLLFVVELVLQNWFTEQCVCNVAHFTAFHVNTGVLNMAQMMS